MRAKHCQFMYAAEKAAFSAWTWRLGAQDPSARPLQLPDRLHVLNPSKITLGLMAVMEEKNPFEHTFGARDVFLTGATGMLGTALLVKLTKDTTISQVHVLVRGGEGVYYYVTALRKSWILMPSRSVLASNAGTLAIASRRQPTKPSENYSAGRRRHQGQSRP